jgi:hypothetical protein
MTSCGVSKWGFSLLSWLASFVFMIFSSLRIVFSLLFGENAAVAGVITPFTVVTTVPYDESGMNDTLEYARAGSDWS